MLILVLLIVLIIIYFYLNRGSEAIVIITKDKLIFPGPLVPLHHEDIYDHKLEEITMFNKNYPESQRVYPLTWHLNYIKKNSL